MSKIHPAIADAFRASKYHYVTKRGDLIPLLCVDGVRSIGPRPAEKELNIPAPNAGAGAKLTEFYRSIEEGSLAVRIAGGKQGFLDGEVVLSPQEIEGFSSAVRRLTAGETPVVQEFPFHPDAALFFELATMHLRRSSPTILDHIYGSAADALLPTSPCHEPFQRLKTLFPESRQQNGYNADYVGAFTAIGLPVYLAELLRYTDSADLSHDSEIRKVERGMMEVQGYILRRCTAPGQNLAQVPNDPSRTSMKLDPR